MKKGRKKLSRTEVVEELDELLNRINNRKSALKKMSGSIPVSSTDKKKITKPSHDKNPK
jgi:hypothetical protein